jgi:cathepsin D
MDDVRVNGDKIFENVPVMIDSGANLIFGDWDQVVALYGHLGGTFMPDRSGFGYYACEFRLRLVPSFYRQPAVPCNSFPTLGLTFGGRTFEIPPEVFRLKPTFEGSTYCFGAIIAQSRSIPFREIHYFSLPELPFAALDGLVLTIWSSMLGHWVAFPAGRI